jgi:hypothetical protein
VSINLCSSFPFHSFHFISFISFHFISIDCFSCTFPFCCLLLLQGILRLSQSCDVVRTNLIRPTCKGYGSHHTGQTILVRNSFLLWYKSVSFYAKFYLFGLWPFHFHRANSLVFRRLCLRFFLCNFDMLCQPYVYPSLPLYYLCSL